MKTAIKVFSVNRCLNLAEPDKAKNAVLSVVVAGTFYCLNTSDKQGQFFTGVCNCVEITAY